jgi:hypothetical protein
LDVVWATSGRVLYQIPDEEEDNVVLKPRQTWLSPITDKVAGGNTVTFTVALDVQPVFASVKINEVFPAEIPVIKPELVMEAIAGFAEDQVPPVLGKSWLLSLTQMADRPISEVPGLANTVTGTEFAEEQPVD